MSSPDAPDREEIPTVKIDIPQKKKKKSAGKKRPSSPKKVKRALQKPKRKKRTKPASRMSYVLMFVGFVVIVGVVIIGIFMVPIWLKSHAGYSEGERYTYNHFVFVRRGILWTTQVQIGNGLYTVPIHYGPREVETLSLHGEINTTIFYGPREVYITFDPEEGGNLTYVALAASELSINLAQAIGRTPVAACTINMSGTPCETRPTVTCADRDVPVIYLKKDVYPKVIMDQNCITIQGNGEDLVKATDRLLFQWYGIMQ